MQPAIIHLDDASFIGQVWNFTIALLWNGYFLNLVVQEVEMRRIEMKAANFKNFLFYSMQL
jgi:hypothetical protein